VEGRAAISARPALAADCGRLAELWEAANGELQNLRGGPVLIGLSERMRSGAASFAQQVENPEEQVVVGTLMGTVVGYGTCRAQAQGQGEPIGQIEELYVEIEARHQGVGRAIAKVLVDWCRARGCAGVDALALPGNRAAKSFFEAEGFTARLIVMHRALVP
jgi:ribosomal protein S18 acetylase RimI-like enzyme